ncbi:MAG: TolC family protein [Alphaproteobacteria bacterium]|nr:MAG: TolC family protein [Alphaproteobacteria bacterium]
MQIKLRPAVLAVLGLFVLVGCAPDVSAPKSAGQLISSDLAQLYHPDDLRGTLSFEDALARGMKYNLDARVAAYNALAASGDVTLAKLAALPAMQAKMDYIGRSNKGAASSLSVLTNTQSLEPSISTEQRRTTQQLALDWNLLDAALSVARAKSSSDQQLIMEERRRKVFHSIVQDIYSAYWRAAAAQELRPLVRGLLAQADDQIGKIDKGIKAGIVVVSDARRMKNDLMAKKQQLIELEGQIVFSDLALKALIGLPPHAQLRLNPADVKWISRQRVPRAGGNMADLEKIALARRPEVREELLNKNIALRDIRLSIFETFPGANIILALNHDNNRFLVDKDWLSITGEISQSITKILTAPARYNKAVNASALADARRQALLAAVMTEVHIASARLRYFNSDYDMVNSIAREKAEDLRRARGFRNAGMSGDTEVVGAALDEGAARINERLAFAQVSESYGQLLSSLGVDIWTGTSAGMSVPQIGSRIKQNIAVLEQDVIKGAYMTEGKQNGL